MQVKELIERLKEMNESLEVYLASDEEGNEIKVIDGVVNVREEDQWESQDGEKIIGAVIFPIG